MDSGDPIAQLKKVFPNAKSFKKEEKGWDSMVINIDQLIIAKVPRNDKAKLDVLKEHSILTIIYPYIKAIAIPLSTLVAHPIVFTHHPIIKGGKLGAKMYQALTPQQQVSIATDLGKFLAELHQIPIEKFKGIEQMGSITYDVSEKLLNMYKSDFTESELFCIRKVIDKYQQYDKDEQVFGHFDIHNDNVAFDLESAKLMGVFDFADSRVDGVYKEFITLSWISFELMKNVIEIYNKLTTRGIKWERTLVETVMFRVTMLGYHYVEDPHRRFKCIEYIQKAIKYYITNF